MIFFFSINILHIDCIMMLLSYTIVDFIYNNNGAEMQICTLLTRIQCKVSDAQVTVKACGPLVRNIFKCFLKNFQNVAVNC